MFKIISSVYFARNEHCIGRSCFTFKLTLLSERVLVLLWWLCLKCFSWYDLVIRNQTIYIWWLCSPWDAKKLDFFLKDFGGMRGLAWRISILEDKVPVLKYLIMTCHRLSSRTSIYFSLYFRLQISIYMPTPYNVKQPQIIIVGCSTARFQGFSAFFVKT